MSVLSTSVRVRRHVRRRCAPELVALGVGERGGAKGTAESLTPQHVAAGAIEQHDVAVGRAGGEDGLPQRGAAHHRPARIGAPQRPRIGIQRFGSARVVAEGAEVRGPSRLLAVGPEPHDGHAGHRVDSAEQRHYDAAPMSSPGAHRIEDLPRLVGQTVTVRGWVTTTRSSGKIAFVVLRDGTGSLQAVLSKKDVSDAAWEAYGKLTQETSVAVTGAVRADPRAPGGVELTASDLRVLGPSHEFPITPKEHGTAYLFEHRHLWLRSRRQVANKYAVPCSFGV